MSAPAESVHRATFHGVPYVLTCTVAAAGAALLVDVEQEESGARWRGEFASKYIEDITQKTGNFKRFAVFVRMLRKALTGESPSVFVDLLTTQDLNALKARRGKNKTSGRGAVGVSSSFDSSASAANVSTGKRYLILTYTGEFDKTHYPLPLAYEDKPNTASLQRTINRLRRELRIAQSKARGADGGASSSAAPTDGEAGTSAAATIAELRAENERLRAATASEHGGRNAQAAREAVEARMELRRFKEIATAEISTLKKDCKSLASKLRDARARQEQAEERARESSASASAARGATKEIRALERRLDNAQASIQREKDAHRRSKSTHKRLTSTLKSEIKALKGQVTRYRLQLRDANRSLSRGPARGRGSSNTPRGRRTKRVVRGRSSGYGSARSQSRSVDRSYGSVSSVHSSRSARSNRSASRSASRSTRTTRMRAAANKKKRSTARVPLRARRTPSPSVRSLATKRPSTGRRSAYSSGGSYRSSARSSARKRVTKKKGTRRSKRHPSPFSYGYSSSESRPSSVDSRKSGRSRSSSRGGEDRAERKTEKKKKTVKTQAKAISGRKVVNPPAPSAVKTGMMEAPSAEVSGENDALTLNISAMGQEQPKALGLAKSGVGMGDDNFNANSEMADIDRRLNALQVSAPLSGAL